MSSLHGGIKGGVRAQVSVPLGSPSIGKSSGQLLSCTLWQTYCTKRSGAGSRSVVPESTVWYLVSDFAFPWRSAKGQKQHLSCLGDGRNTRLTQ